MRVARLAKRRGALGVFTAMLTLVGSLLVSPTAGAWSCPQSGIVCEEWWDEKVAFVTDTVEKKRKAAEDLVGKIGENPIEFVTGTIDEIVGQGGGPENLPGPESIPPGGDRAGTLANSATLRDAACPGHCLVSGVGDPRPSTFDHVPNPDGLVPHPEVPAVEPDLPQANAPTAPRCDDLATPLGGLLDCHAPLSGASVGLGAMGHGASSPVGEPNPNVGPGTFLDLGPMVPLEPGAGASPTDSATGLVSQSAAGAGVPGGFGPTRSAELLGAMATLLVVVPILALLARRISQSAALRHPVRAAVLDALAVHPGLTASALGRELGMDRTTALYHLRVLRRFGLIEAWRDGGRDRYFRVGGVDGELPKRLHSMLACGNARRVLDALAAKPGASLNALSADLGMPKSTVKWHVDKLRERGILDPSKRIVPDAAAAMPASGPATAIR
jgi:DNA-binding transcriptional ArsR family regulator